MSLNISNTVKTFFKVSFLESQLNKKKHIPKLNVEKIYFLNYSMI